MLDKPTNGEQLKRLLPRGSQRRIADKIGRSPASVSMALDEANPVHPAVIEAVRIIKEAGTVDAARDLQALLDQVQPTAA